MLSKFLNSARDLLALKPKSDTDTAGSTPAIASESAAMVTTRSHSGSKSATESQQEEPQITSSQNGSGKKRRRSVDRDAASPKYSKVETPPSSKRQRQLPLRSKDEVRSSPRTRVVVEIPAKNGMLSSTVDLAEESQEEDGIEIQLPKKSEREILDSADGSEIDSSDTSETRGKVQKTTKKESPKKPTRSEESDPKHVRFGSEDTPTKDLSALLEGGNVIPVQQEEESSDEDDAPEEVVTQDAFNSVKSKEREAARAVEEQQLTERKKRKERDARLKKQAETAGKKRKKATQIEEDEESLSEIELESDENLNAKTQNKKRRSDGDETTVTLTGRKQKDLPFYLPEELLEDDEEEPAMDLDLVREVKRPKKIKFSELLEKKPKDKRVGSTIYRVAGVSHPSLAPKATQQARSTKEQWLKGRSGKAVGIQRKPFKSGFFVSGKKSTYIRRP
ncbi:hypothetical protein B7463_g2822, partial [Scytalidium lignicola]